MSWFETRLEELNRKRETQGLNLDSERREFERLFNAAQEVARNPELQQARAERNRIIQETARQNALAHIKRTSVVRNGKRVILSDVQSNDTILDSLLNPGEELTPEWFLEHFAEPAFDRLVWEPWLTLQQRKAQTEKDETANRQRALSLTRQYGLSECESNLNALANSNGTVVRANNTPYLFSDTEEIQLVPASQSELQKYVQEKQDKHQAYLRELRDKGDIQGLKAAAAAERAGQQQTFELTWRQRLEQDLIRQYERDTLAGYRTPLPQHYDAVAIRKFDAQKMREVMSRFGASRITARLYGITEVENGHGGTIKFE